MDIFSDFINNASILSLFDKNDDILALIVRFILNFLVIGSIITYFYYPKSKRSDYHFTFSLIGVSVFLLVFLLGSVKVKIGFAIGIFAIFGIIRYRTDVIPIREMTYLFIVIAISVINGLAKLNLLELVVPNLIFIISLYIFEHRRWVKHRATKLIIYDKIDLVKPERREELIADIEERTGLKVVRIDVGRIDFLRDSAELNVYYDLDDDEINSLDKLSRFSNYND